MKKTILLLFILLSFGASAGVFNYIVAKDGSGTDTTLQSAINKCPDNVRSYIYIKNGSYYEHISIGTKASPSKKLISLIGENRDSVILFWNKSMANVSTFEETTCLQVYAKNFYAENMTISNTAGNTGQALALYNAGDGFILNKCKITGYQDTYRAKKGTRGYIRNSIISGATDFIYAGGTVIIDDTELRCVKGGGYICAPEDAAYFIYAYETTRKKLIGLEYIFRNCTITAESGVSNGSYYLGRPWGSPTSSAYYLNCKMGPHINAKGWQSWNGAETSASFAEYNSMDLSGNPVDTTSRASWSFQLAKADVDKFFTPTFIYNRVSSTVLFDPVPSTEAVTKPVVGINSNGYFWKPVAGAAGYMILKGDQFVTTTTDTTYMDLTMSIAQLNVKTIGALGQLSESASVVMGTNKIQTETKFKIVGSELLVNTPQKIKIFDAQGKMVFNSEKESTHYLMENLKGIHIVVLMKDNLSYKLNL